MEEDNTGYRVVVAGLLITLVGIITVWIAVAHSG